MSLKHKLATLKEHYIFIIVDYNVINFLSSSRLKYKMFFYFSKNV